LRGETDQTGLVVSAIPVLAFARQDGRFTLDFGAGLALLGKSAYARQDFGGALQFALTLGFSVPLYKQMGVGYRFMHYSDGGAYGSEPTGADFHMIELIYRF
ncbi:MAG TPA: acyloxyacyl hydrolase, partial [Burkholderiaceae bacterium]|nr:acyloxyacyl hydrolase [Burkholderiaceae bacterium]